MSMARYARERRANGRLSRKIEYNSDRVLQAPAALY
jgi:hypothetical protein